MPCIADDELAEALALLPLITTRDEELDELRAALDEATEACMPIKRRVAKAREHHLTPAALKAYRNGDALMLSNAIELV